MILYIAIYKRLSGRDPGDFHRYQLRTWHSLYQKAGISLFLPRITGIPDLFSSRLFSFSVARSPFHDLYAHVLALRVILAFKLRVLHPVLSLSLSLSLSLKRSLCISHLRRKNKERWRTEQLLRLRICLPWKSNTLSHSIFFSVTFALVSSSLLLCFSLAFVLSFVRSLSHSHRFSSSPLK